MVKNLSANAGATGDISLMQGQEDSPRGGHGNPLQYSCLENPMGRRVWRATVHEVTKNWHDSSLSSSNPGLCTLILLVLCEKVPHLYLFKRGL